MQGSDRWPERVNCQSGGGELNVRADGFGPLLLPLGRHVPKKATKRKRLGPCAHRAIGERWSSVMKRAGVLTSTCAVWQVPNTVAGPWEKYFMSVQISNISPPVQPGTRE